MDWAVSVRGLSVIALSSVVMSRRCRGVPSWRSLLRRRPTRDRQRFLVEKLAELGVARLLWLKTTRGKNRVASGAKVFSWVLSAVEQSRGAWLMETSSDLVGWSDLARPVVICHPGGDTEAPQARTVVIGPEGGFSDEELPSDVVHWDLGPTILRVESAAIVAVARLMS